MRKLWKLTPTNEEEVKALQKELKIHPVFCQLLVQRGIKTFEEAKYFFRPNLMFLHDPFLMKDMEVALERIEKAILNKEKVLLYGDYDVDGTTSVALMHTFFSKYLHDIDYYIPDRYKEGYGVSMAGIDYAKQNGISLIIAMDCGITATTQVKTAKNLGIDFIICDHHLPKEKLPEAVAILNPKRSDCTYPFKELSGCGVVFKLVQAFVDRNDLPRKQLWDLLDFVVISIACDIVPIVDENRILAYYGMEKLNTSNNRIGIKALINESGRKLPLSISDIVFGIGPLVNAAGRLADAHTAVHLMLCDNKYVAYENARTLKNRNERRKEMDLLIGEEVKMLFKQLDDWEKRKSIVFFQPHWHKGVIGIAASRVAEHFNRPAIILTESNGLAVGSARSIRGFDIHEAIEQCSDLLENFGGHTFAAGLSMEIENVDKFAQRFESIASEHLTEEQLVHQVDISAILDLKDITPAFWNILRQFAPFGPGNRSPVFATKNVEDIGYSKLLHGNHLKLAIKQNGSDNFYGIAFKRGDDLEKVKTKQPFHICYKIEENNWKEKSYLQLMIKDLKY
jgi:single-stranded-DNA-specific exonuclease